MNFKSYDEYKKKCKIILSNLEKEVVFNVQKEFRDNLYKRINIYEPPNKINYFKTSFNCSFIQMYLQKNFNLLKEEHIEHILKYKKNAITALSNKNFEHVIVICQNRVDKEDSEIVNFVNYIISDQEKNLSFRPINSFNEQWFLINIKNRTKKNNYIDFFSKSVVEFNKHVFAKINENMVSLKKIDIKKEWKRFLIYNMKFSLEKYYHTFKQLDEKMVFENNNKILENIKENSLIIFYDNADSDYSDEKFTNFNDIKILNKILSTNNCPVITISKNKNYLNTILECVSIANLNNLNDLSSIKNWNDIDDNIVLENYYRLADTGTITLNSLWKDALSFNDYIDDINDEETIISKINTPIAVKDNKPVIKKEKKPIVKKDNKPVIKKDNKPKKVIKEKVKKEKSKLEKILNDEIVFEVNKNITNTFEYENTNPTFNEEDEYLLKTKTTLDFSNVDDLFEIPEITQEEVDSLLEQERIINARRLTESLEHDDSNEILNDDNSDKTMNDFLMSDPLWEFNKNIKPVTKKPRKKRAPKSKKNNTKELLNRTSEKTSTGIFELASDGSKLNEITKTNDKIKTLDLSDEFKIQDINIDNTNNTKNNNSITKTNDNIKEKKHIAKSNKSKSTNKEMKENKTLENNSFNSVTSESNEFTKKEINNNINLEKDKELLSTKNYNKTNKGKNILTDDLSQITKIDNMSKKINRDNIFDDTFTFSNDINDEKEKLINRNNMKEVMSWYKEFESFVDRFAKMKNNLNITNDSFNQNSLEEFDDNLKKLNTKETYQFLLENSKSIFEKLSDSNIRKDAVLNMYTLYLHIKRCLENTMELIDVNEKNIDSQKNKKGSDDDGDW